MEGYKTLKGPGEDSFIIKKSRFIGHGSPADTEQEALAFLARVREAHRDASHNCYAYIIGRNEGIMRYSDDGEPGGTAGMPILECLRMRGIVNCCAVVTRYFGGVLLGAGGLTRAYAQGAKAAVDAAGILVMTDSVRFLLEVAYPLWDRVQHYLRSAPILQEGTDFGAAVTATLLTRKSDQGAVFDALTRLTDGRAELMPVEDICHGWALTGENGD